MRALILVVFLPVYMLFAGEANLACDRHTVFTFAEQLLASRAYKEASLEYLRYLRYFPDDTLNPSIQFRLAYCYERQGKLIKARREYLSLINNYEKGPLREFAIYRWLLTYYIAGEYDSLLTLIDESGAEHEHAKLKQALEYLRIWAYFDQLKLEDARRLLEAQSKADNFLSPSMSYLLSKTRQVRYLPRKSPLLSGFLSTIVPGLGQGYCERWGDAFYSFVLSVGGIGSAYYFWDRDRGFSLLTGTIGLFFYLGNIYGAIGSAILYNEEKGDDFVRKAHAEIPQPPEEILRGDINDQ